MHCILLHPGSPKECLFNANYISNVPMELNKLAPRSALEKSAGQRCIFTYPYSAEMLFWRERGAINGEFTGVRKRY